MIYLSRLFTSVELSVSAKVSVESNVSVNKRAGRRIVGAEKALLRQFWATAGIVEGGEI